MTSKQVILEADQRLSRSLLWDMQRRYFLRSGVAAWQDDVVPSAISCNPVMARTYSQLALGYLRDVATAVRSGAWTLNPDQPIYIIELGAGSGRLSYHFLHHFLPRLETLFDLPAKLLLTDFVPQTVAFWQAHERLRPFVSANLLDFAHFDVMDKRPLHLQQANLTLTPDQMQNPVILLANYFFDSIPQDSFALEDGQLCENLLTLTSSQPEPDHTDPALWQRLALAYEAIPLAKPYYDQPLYNQILDDYEAHFPDTSLSFPNVGLDCLRFWQGFGQGRLLLLSSDRGYTLPDALIGQPDPLPNLHGSFSLMVNYHAIGEYVQRSNGRILQTDHYQDNLQTVAYLLNPPPSTAETTLAFDTAVVNNGPDDFFALRQSLAPVYDQLTLPQLLSFLRHSGYDADIVRDTFTALLAQVQSADPAWYPDVADALHHIWHGYLPLRPDDDLAQLLRPLLAIMEIDTASFLDDSA